MAKTPEAKQRDPVMEWCKKRGIQTIRLSFGAGVATGHLDDLIMIPGGRPVFFEAKADGKSPTKKQINKAKTYYEAGYDVGWYDNKDKAIEALTRVLERTCVPKEGCIILDGPGGRSAVFGPRFGKDKHNTRCLFETPKGRGSQKDAGDRPTQGLSTGVEAGSEEVVTVQTSEVRTPPWLEEGESA